MKVWSGTLLVIFMWMVAQTAEANSDAKKTTCPCGLSKKGRIIGGSEVNPNEYPWIAMLIYSSNPLPLCGSSIVTEKIALTAAHCTRSAKKGQPLSIIAGRNEVSYYRDAPGQMVSVERYIEHEGFYTTSKNTLNDIALLILAQPLKFNANVAPVCLPTTERYDLDGKWVKVLGWGKLGYELNRSMKLMEVDLQVQPYSYCKSIYAMEKTQTQICYETPGKSSCYGDSGGPVVYLDPETNRYTLVGITSFGDIKCETDYPAVAADVVSYLPWIKSKINTLGCQKVETRGERPNKKQKVETPVEAEIDKKKPEADAGIKEKTTGPVGNKLSFVPFVPRFNRNKGPAQGAQNGPGKLSKAIDANDLDALLNVMKKNS